MFQELREHEREPFEKKLDYSVNVLDFKKLTRLSLKADAINISEGGLCIHTGYPLENGHILKFHNKAGQCAGIVMWSSLVSDATFSTGVKFIQKGAQNCLRAQ